MNGGMMARWRAFLERRRQLVAINRRNLELVYPNNPRRHFPVANDKLLAKQVLGAAGVPFAPTLAVCRGLFAIPDVLDALENQSDFVVKPASGGGGRGILVIGERIGPGFWRRAGGETVTREEIGRRLADIVFGAYSNHLADVAFVERRVRPHPFFQGLWPDGLCDIRVITLHAVPVMAMVRVPTRRSEGRANLHQGGIGLAVDLGSGTTTRAVSQGRLLGQHPESGAPLIGLTLPFWSDVLAVACRAAAAAPLGYLGVDIVVDEAVGPLLLEVNARPGLEIQNVHGRPLGAFLRDAFAEAA